MNWIFEAYSNVYKFAMMRAANNPILFAATRADPKKRVSGRLSRGS